MLHCVPILSLPHEIGQKVEKPSYLFETSFVSSSSGSCYASYNGCKVLATVHGPHMTQNKGFDSDVCSLECEVKYSSSSSESDNQMTSRERQLAEYIKDSLASAIRLSLYPKSTIFLSVLIMEDSTQEDLSVAINTSSLALIDSGVELYDIVTASCYTNIHNSTYVTIAEMTKLNEVTMLVSEGQIYDDFTECLNTCQAACRDIRSMFDKHIISQIV